MTTPQRIQLRRAKGWRKPEGAVVVSRPSRWGNPFAVVPVRRGGPFDLWEGDPWGGRFIGQYTAVEAARTAAVERYRDHIGFDQYIPAIRDELRGHDLACWCPLEDAEGNRVPCHADVLLEIANKP